MELEAFLLTRAWRDGPDGLSYVLWGSSPDGPVRVTLTGQEAVFFVHRGTETEAGRRETVDLTALDGRPVDAVHFASRRDLRREADRLRTSLAEPLESDVKPLDRFLMERFVTGSFRVRGEPRQREGFLDFRNPHVARSDHAPRLTTLSFDLETDGAGGPILSIAVAGLGGEHVFVRESGPETAGLSYHRDERALLEAFLAHVAHVDPDVLVGWNCIEADLLWLEDRCRANGLRLTLGRGGERATVLTPRTPAQPHVARVPGRVVLDGIATLRSATWTFESFRLEDVGRILLGRGKRIEDTGDKVEEIRRMFREDKPALAAYNLEDARLVLDIFAHTQLLDFAVERQRLTGLPMDRQGGSVAAFDWLYLPRLHRHGHVAPDVGHVEGSPSPGGYVLESRPGFYDNVLVLDFKSLYPSIIRTFRIDPMGMAFPGDAPVDGFGGARFHRDEHILPELIETLWAARDRARRDENAALSRAIKILMNSFYGVLGTPGCRFFDPRLASSITRRGHEIITRSRDWIAERWPVIYGDTDSLFVWLGAGHDEETCRRIGADLARDLNVWWKQALEREHGVESRLEIEFETHYLRFLMPTLRGNERGTKKRYAGNVRRRDGSIDMVFKGLEAVRTDWTPLARRFQRELFRRIFADEPWEAWCREIADGVRAGELDAELVYHKRLRRALEDYADHAPPHVQAARKLGLPVRDIHYVITTRGPEPAAAQRSPLDHQHYLDRQLAPAADVLLHFVGTTFEAVTGKQMSLF